MLRICATVKDLIGETPLLSLDGVALLCGQDVRLLGKLEGFNPGGSAKDRVALYMLEDAERCGLLKRNSVIIEPTSGNTGIGLAMVGSLHGYRTIIVMPDSMSEERRRLVRAYGAELVLTPAAEGMTGAIKKAEELAMEIPNAYIPGQFTNPANVQAHYEMTGPEIWLATEGMVDIFVAGVGTGGTITGVGKYLKEQNPDIKVIAVEPANSPVLSDGESGAHGLQGIGAGFVPEILDTSIYDEVITIMEEEAYTAARELAKRDGILAGISSGAALAAAIEVAKRPENKHKNIVVLLPDTGERYLSTPLFAENE